MSDQAFQETRTTPAPPAGAIDGELASVSVLIPGSHVTPALVRGLRIECVAAEPAVVVTAVGDVDTATIGVLNEQLWKVRRLTGPSTALVLDLQEVRFFGAAGLTLLLATHEHCVRRGVALHILTTQHSVLRLTQITGLFETLPVVPALPAELAERLQAAPAPPAAGEVTKVVRSGSGEQGPRRVWRALFARRAPGRHRRPRPTVFGVAEAKHLLQPGSTLPR